VIFDASLAMFVRTSLHSICSFAGLAAQPIHDRLNAEGAPLEYVSLIPLYKYRESAPQFHYHGRITFVTCSRSGGVKQNPTHRYGISGCGLWPR